MSDSEDNTKKEELSPEEIAAANAELRDKSQEDPREMNAADRGLSYVGLDGNIGCAA